MPHCVSNLRPATSEAAKPSNKGTKRKIHDPDGLAHKAQIQNSGNFHLAAPASAMASKVSGKRKSCGDAGHDDADRCASLNLGMGEGMGMCQGHDGDVTKWGLRV